ncbi:MAG: GNAT family N-acetyltransferase, partial [Methanococcaceae archaeon]
MIKTPRLMLVPATSEMLKAETGDRSRLSDMLNAFVPNSWPPESLRDAIPWFLEQIEKKPGQECWYFWYVILAEGDSPENILVGSAGFKGAPDEKGIVETGYSVLEEYQGRSIATEMVSAITEWALSQSGVKMVTAQTMDDNHASKRVLEKCKFSVKEQQGRRVFFIRSQ